MQKIYANIYVKYLGIYLDQHLDWSPHVNHLIHKLVKANAMLCKLRHYVNEATIKSIYQAIFHSHLSYVCTARGQNLNPNHRISLLQKKAIRIISLFSFCTCFHSSIQYTQTKHQDCISWSFDKTNIQYFKIWY